MLRELIAFSVIAACASAQSHSASLDRYMRVDAVVDKSAAAGAGAVVLNIRNLHQKEVTALQISYVVQYSDGSQTEQTWGVDLVGSSAQLAALGATRPDWSTLKPGETLSQNVPLPDGPGGLHAVLVTGSAKTLVFSDGTAAGDSMFIKGLAVGRAKSASAIGEALGEAEKALAEPNPQAAFDARISQLWDGRFRPGQENVGILRAIAFVFANGGRPQAEEYMRSLEARRNALMEHVALQEGGIQ